MKKLITAIFFIVVSHYSYCQNLTRWDTAKVDISGRSNASGISLVSSDQSNGAGDYFDSYTKITKTGLIFNLVGTGVMTLGFSIQPKTIKEYNKQTAIFIVGGSINIIGLIIQIGALNKINSAAYRLRSKKLGLLINDNGIGFQLAIN